MVSRLGQFETVKGEEKSDEIIAAAELDAMSIGPYHLTTATGISSQLYHSRIDESIGTRNGKVKVRGVALGSYADNYERLKGRLKSSA